ncbi:hypothetical protein LXL04_001966 [Taraxacum kok-saghyz]
MRTPPEHSRTMFELLNQLDGFEASNKIKIKWGLEKIKKLDFGTSMLLKRSCRAAEVMSGDDDVLKRDDIGERRKKHENKGLASAGIQSDDDDELQNDETTIDGVNDTNKDGETELETDLYKETKIKLDAKLAAKAQKYSRTAPAVGMPETLVEGERHINYDEMDKNRGLTRKSNNELKKPRKKYNLKHKKKEVAWKRVATNMESRYRRLKVAGKGEGKSRSTMTNDQAQMMLMSMG